MRTALALVTMLCLLTLAPAALAEEDVQPTAVVTPEAACDHVVRIAPSGIKFSPASLEVADGDTVCWQWTNESMAHNVVETTEEGGTTPAEGGIDSGEANSTMDFRVTFTGDQTFNYVCEPHASSGMVATVTVGEGDAVDEPEATTGDDEGEDTPGFAAITAVVALAGAALMPRRRA